MRRRPGTNVRATPDVAAIAAALRRPGIDTRSWVEYGTVATVGGPDGAPDFTDPNAVLVTPNGVEVDVVVGVYEQPITCRYGLQNGDVSIVTPIRAGDHVLVLMPDGEHGTVGEVLKILPGPGAQLPLEEDRSPVFKNDRVSIFSKLVPIEIRTAGGSKVTLEQDGTATVTGPSKVVAAAPDVRLGGADATEQLVKGTSYRAAEASLDAQDELALTTLVAAFATRAGLPVEVAAFTALYPGTNALLLAIGAYATARLAALQAFEGQAATFLSQVSKTK